MADDPKKIDTGGGTYADGDVDTGGGDFTGRDKHIGGDEIHGDSHVGDKISMSGNFGGAIINVKATLTHVTQQINALPQAGDKEKAKLAHLVSRLEESLAQVPPDKHEEAEAVAELAHNLIAAAAQEKPNQTMVRISGDGLQEAASNLETITPAVPEIATKIVALVRAVAA